jgi:hypothetical protein
MRRALNRDQNDAAKLRHGYTVHEGRDVAGIASSYFPFFFTREGATVHLNGLYRGAGAFLTGGGPSFREIDPAPLRRVWTMTLNNGPASFRPQANCTVDDPSRFNLSTWLDPLIMKFVPMAQFEKPLWDNRFLPHDSGGGEQRWERAKAVVGDCPNVIGYRRNEKFHAPRWLREDTINWGNHKKYGGGRSVMLAALRILHLLGFRRVWLLGVDYEMTAERRYHFEEARTEGAIRGNASTYARLKEWLTELQPSFLKDGYVVRNCHLASRLTAFPFQKYEDAVAEATAPLGDPGRERTSGMYAKLAEKEQAVGSGKASDPPWEPRRARWSLAAMRSWKPTRAVRQLPGRKGRPAARPQRLRFDPVVPVPAGSKASGRRTLGRSFSVKVSRSP